MTRLLDEMFLEKKLKDLPPSEWRRWMFLESPRAGDIRGCVARLWEFAENQGILDAEMLARVGNEDYEQFRSVINELAIGEFLSSIGSIDWHPPGRNSHISNCLGKTYIMILPPDLNYSSKRFDVSS
jgi:hypothetical protein